MASSSSFASNSQYCAQWKYDVFLSFRGADTRRTFTGHLYEGLKNRGIFTFQDDKRLEHGDSISQELLKAIEESQVAVIVFSKNYAMSRWCLNELVKIMECKVENGQIVIPVFYDVDPSHVRYQSESFAETFAKHESRYKDDVEGMQKVQGWRTALTGAANLKGYDIRDGIESECIRKLVDDVSSKLCKTFSSYLQDIVGIDTHLEKVKSLLEMETNDVRIVGIWGMGGVGKTTIARAVFDTLSPQFQGASFLADIKETKTNEMHSLQNILLSELLREDKKYVNNKEEGKRMMAHRLRFMKVLVVLDDINHHDHWEYLAGHLCWFGPGSRIIATTRNKQILGMNNAVHEVTTLLEHDAIRLFNQHAFKGEAPNEHIKKLSLEVVSHAKGLPLALRLWGIWLHNQDKTMWREIVDMIKRESSPDIVKNLKISFEGLQDKEKTIFLDIACFFRGWKKDETIEILESYDLGARIRLHGLIEKSLVFISKYNTIQMHDLIQDMGTYVVNMQTDSGKPSRLWNIEDFEDVVNNTGIMAMEAIWCTYVQKLYFSKDAMINMKRIRILCICDENDLSRITYSSSSDSNCHDDSIEYLPNNLCWFVWHDYPWKLLPEYFNPRRLVHLDLRWSSLHHLWNETKQLPSLRRLNLSCSKSLKRTPDFKGMPNLEYLYLGECMNLEEVHHSLGCSRKLIHLNLNYCERLKRFPYVNVESLESLNLSFCYSLKKFPEILGRMKPELEIKMSDSGIRELPLCIIHPQAHLTELHLNRMKYLVALPSSICKLKGLVKLDVSNCAKLESLPEEIGDLGKLEQLDANYTLISRPPSSIVRLNNLKLLNFTKVNSEDRLFFVFPQVNEGLLSLEYLDLSYCNIKDGGLPEDIGSLSSLKVLHLRGNNFEYLPQSIAQLGALEYLYLSDCKSLTQLPEFPRQLDRIDADWSNDLICNSLFQNMSSLQHDICSSDSFSLRVFRSWGEDIPSWFKYHGMGKRVSINLPENWYESDKFLGFAVCYTGIFIDDFTAHLIPLCDDGMSSMTQKFSLSNHSEYINEDTIKFLLVPLGGLWDASNANEKTPNDYGCIKLDDFKATHPLIVTDDFEVTDHFEVADCFAERRKFGVHLLYKDESELCIGIRNSRYEEEASCSSSKKQRQLLQLFPTSPGL
ncbi:TMV resistance protein N-like [Solanum stenotomum]|uniref:TMV resistance protein N-like n=1 Tax=Solanum stenotomum TaxID=172797 RepID=UPI0020D0D739|nr:TMV resistance protein N-like [Solanum stenotomum]